jgi:hypothetical protein
LAGISAMKTLRIQSQSGSDGKLRLEIPVETPNAFYDVVIVMQPGRSEEQPRAADEGRWPPGFCEATADVWQGDFVRDQGQFEEREQR